VTKLDPGKDPFDFLYEAVMKMIKETHRTISITDALVNGQREYRVRLLSDIPQALLGEAERDVVFVLSEVGHRLTGEEMADELERRNLIYSRKGMFEVMARMVKTGVLDNRKDVRPRGYGLVAWEGRPYASTDAEAADAGGPPRRRRTSPDQAGAARGRSQSPARPIPPSEATPCPVVCCTAGGAALPECDGRRRPSATGRNRVPQGTPDTLHRSWAIPPREKWRQ
jgi:hypothetical protein